MAERRGRREAGKRKRADAEPPIPLDAVDLLAGIAPGVELVADDLPPDIEGAGDGPERATMTVAEAGRLLRTGDRTIRRLIRNPVLRPAPAGGSDAGDVDRAGVPPRTRSRRGE